MGFDTRNGFEVVHEPVSDFMQLPYFFEPVVEERRLLLQFFAERALVPERGEEMVENLVVPDDPFIGGASFETGNFVREPFGVLRFEPYPRMLREVHENCPERYGNGDDKEYGDILHVQRIPRMFQMSRIFVIFSSR